MSASVDKDLCIGCELCVDICPEVFVMGDDGLAEAFAEVTPENEDNAKDAAASCPTEAITVE